MAKRIPQHFIDEVLARTDIVDIIDSYVPLKKAGQNYKACCPFHSEKTPSFTVSQNKQFYHCFGCGANGSAIGFLMEYDHMEFVEAIERLANALGLEVPTENQSAQTKKAKNGLDLYQLMNKVDHYYQQQLRVHPQKDLAIAYLKQRGLSGETAKRFHIGYAPNAWDSLHTQLGNSSAAVNALMSCGLLSEKNQKHYDRFRHRIIFPIHDHRGRVVGFGGRSLDNEQGPKYLNSPETSIFHKGSELYGLYAARGAIKQADQVLVVEGYMDVVALAQAGIDHAVATLGTATTPMHLQRLLRYTHNLCFCFDGDRAGNDAAWKALQTLFPLLQDGHQISFLFLPDGEDPDSMVQKEGKTAFLERIGNATPLPDYFIDTLSQGIDLQRIDGKANLSKQARPLLQQLSEGVLKNLIIKQLAQKTHIAEYDLGNYAANQPSQQTRKAPQKNAPHQSMTPLRRLLSLILQNPKLALGIQTHSLPDDTWVHGMPILKDVIQSIQANPDTNTARIIERYRQQNPNHAATLQQLCVYQHHIEANQTESACKKLLDTLHQEANSNRIDQLIEKDQNHGLNQAEKDLLRELYGRMQTTNLNAR